VLPAIQEWRNRRLQSFYPVVYMDAIYFKVRYEGSYEDRAFYTVYSIDWEGKRDLLGMYIQGYEGASRWATVLHDLKRRGVKDILVACVDDLTGFSEAITDFFPATIVQKCIVHQVRASLRYVDEKDRKKVASALRAIYTSPTLEQASAALQHFDGQWGSKYEFVTRQWEDKWGELMAFLDFPQAMRKMIYTTNPVEALHRIVRKLVKSKAAWVSETALTKQIYLSLMHNEKSWKRNAYGWKSVQRDLLRQYEQRITRVLE
jgi:putative transposase